MAERIKAADLGELAEGDMKAVEGAGRTAVVLNVGGDFYAIDDECTHSACPLSAGDLDGESWAKQQTQAWNVVAMGVYSTSGQGQSSKGLPTIRYLPIRLALKGMEST